MRAGGGAGFGNRRRHAVCVRCQIRRCHCGGQWWRLVTAGFLHGGLLHILMNSWVLFDLAPQVEEMFGRQPHVGHLFRFVGGRVLLEQPVESAVASVGASAALCGLIGAMIALGVTHHSAAMERPFAARTCAGRSTS